MPTTCKQSLPTTPAARQQRGTTMVSLIVGVALSMFLIAGIIQIFTVVKRNYQLSENIAEMNSSVRFAANFMYNAIANAGYLYPASATSSVPTLAVAFPAYASGSGASCTGCYIYPNITNAVTIQFQGNGTSNTDCAGNIVAAGTRQVIQFSVGTIPGTTRTGLLCSNMNASGVAVATYPLMYDLVDSMQVQYGYDYINAGNVSYYNANDSAHPGRIRAVRIGLLLHSRDNVINTTAATTQTFSLFGNTITRTSSQLYRLHVLTVPLNQLPTPLVP